MSDPDPAHPDVRRAADRRRRDARRPGVPRGGVRGDRDGPPRGDASPASGHRDARRDRPGAVAAGVPSFAQKFVGDEINIVQVERWTPSTPPTSPSPIPGKPGDIERHRSRLRRESAAPPTEDGRRSTSGSASRSSAARSSSSSGDLLVGRAVKIENARVGSSELEPRPALTPARVCSARRPPAPWRHHTAIRPPSTTNGPERPRRAAASAPARTGAARRSGAAPASVIP